MNSEMRPAEAGNPKFLNKLAAMGIDVHACFQCGRCSSGCPVADYFDLTVMQVVRLASYGMEDILLQSKTIWLCAACETCATRCPNAIEIAGLMDVLRSLALKKGIEPAEPRVPKLHRSFLESVRHWGRAYEVGMLAAYKLRSGDLAGDMKLGMQMLTRGKLKLLPQGIRGKGEIRRIFAGKGKEYER